MNLLKQRFHGAGANFQARDLQRNPTVQPMLRAFEPRPRSGRTANSLTREKPQSRKPHNTLRFLDRESSLGFSSCHRGGWNLQQLCQPTDGQLQKFCEVFSLGPIYAGNDLLFRLNSVSGDRFESAHTSNDKTDSLI